MRSVKLYVISYLPLPTHIYSNYDAHSYYIENSTCFAIYLTVIGTFLIFVSVAKLSV